MKKILSLAACSAMVFGFAATASAVHIEAPAETSPVVAKGGLLHIDGSIRHRGIAESNQLTDSATNEQHTKAWYDGRVRLGVNAQTSDAISGYMLLENGFGTKDYYIWGEEDPVNSLFNGGEKKDSLQILEAWVQYKPANWGVKVGHMPLALGNKLFFDHTGSGDDAIVGFFSPSDQMDLGVLTVKFNEGDLLQSGDDIDGYVAYGVYRLSEALNLGANYTYLNIGSMVTGLEGAGFSNLGITVDGKVGIFTYGVDGEFQFGDWLADMNGDGNLDKAKGIAFKANGGVDFDGLKAGVLVGYGTGDDTLDDDADQFLNFLTDTAYESYFAGYRQAIPTQGPGALNIGKNTGFSNLLLVQLNGSASVQDPIAGKGLDLKAKVNWMKLNEVAGTADDDLGVEVILLADWQLGNGLVYGVEGSYLFAGDAWDTFPGAGDAENGFFLRHRLELKF